MNSPNCILNIPFIIGFPFLLEVDDIIVSIEETRDAMTEIIITIVSILSSILYIIILLDENILFLSI
jgi:hypothetical protein